MSWHAIPLMFAHSSLYEQSCSGASVDAGAVDEPLPPLEPLEEGVGVGSAGAAPFFRACLLYTSDAADE